MNWTSCLDNNKKLVNLDFANTETIHKQTLWTCMNAQTVMSENKSMVAHIKTMASMVLMNGKDQAWVPVMYPLGCHSFKYKSSG